MITRPNVKINLGLNIIAKRPDGFHDLKTLFFPCHDISDTLEIIPADAFSETSASLFKRYSVPGQIVQGITADGKVMITIARREGVDWDPLKDLTVKAYELLSGDFGLPPVKIFLEKTSPVGAGLGGGSADAAFALRMLSCIGGLDLSDELLAGYAARLGSDCAFFIYNRPMFGEGRGEILTPFEGTVIPEGCTLRVVVPEGISISTAEAYRNVRPLKDSERPMPLEEALLQPVDKWKDCLFNDFENTLLPSRPALAALKRKLYEDGAVYASMSGSGSAFFGIFPEKS